MKLHKIRLLAVGYVIATMAGVNSSAMAASDTATITITGTVKDNTCTLDKSDIPVTLPDVSIRDFAGEVDKEIESVSIPVSFSNCGSGSTNISVVVSGSDDSDSSSGKVFKNTGTATGIGVVLYDANDTKFNTNGTTIGQLIDVKDGSATATYVAKYISTKNIITAGTVSAVLTAKFIYN